MHLYHHVDKKYQLKSLDITSLNQSTRIIKFTPRFKA